MLFKAIVTFATFTLSVVSVIAAPTGDTRASALVKKAQPLDLCWRYAVRYVFLTADSSVRSSSSPKHLPSDYFFPALVFSLAVCSATPVSVSPCSAGSSRPPLSR
ncbi:hypothetical protein BDY19DRAFT_936300 [Irpex rosettiformis]|uniref:Uncharacterized protein n=1 Tax=Irpex rosettiformis TaxID=378272 RepID=A0ACB8U8B6_9APHY|nr:hypothetical protein BDY19DRAFT_936300 [Irpex rosettiformis]